MPRRHHDRHSPAELLSAALSNNYTLAIIALLTALAFHFLVMP